MAKSTGTTGPLAALDFVRAHCRDVTRMERDRDLELRLVLRSKVELALQSKGIESVLGRDGAGRIKLQLPPVKLTCPQKDRCGNPTRGCIRELPPSWAGAELADDTEVERLAYCSATLSRPLAQEKDGKLLIEASQDMLRSIYEQIGRHRIAPPRPVPSDAAEKERDEQLLLGNDAAWQVACLRKQLEELVCPDHVSDRVEAWPIQAPLVYLYCLHNQYGMESKGVSELADTWGVRDEVFSWKGWYDGRKNWTECSSSLDSSQWIAAVEDESGGGFRPVENHRGNVSGVIQIDRKKRVVLPITVWRRGDHPERYILNTPPSEPRLDNTPAILANPDTPVILTDSVEIALENDRRPNGEDEVPTAIWSTWYGELEAVELIDWECLKGRTVFYLIAPDPYLPEEEAVVRAYDTAYAVCEKVSSLRGTRISFVELPAERGRDGDDAPPTKDALAWSVEQFVHVHEAFRLTRQVGPKSKTFAPRSMRDLVAADVESRPFLLEPVLPERSTTLVYAKTNIGKTWFALCVSAAIAHGAKLFDRWRAGKPRKVLYIDCEMDERAMQERVDAVSKMSFSKKRLPPKYSRNLFVLSRSRTSSRIDQFKRDVVEFVRSNKVALLVLDNLAAFTQHNDSSRAWEDLHVWIDELKAVGCAALIIHHEAKHGGQRGTSATTNAVDNVFHLVDPNDPSEKRKQRGRKKEEEEPPKGTSPDQPVKGPTTDDAKKEPPKRTSPDQPNASPGGLVMKLKVEKGRDIYGAARLPFVVRIDPQAYPPTCHWEELPKDDIDYVEGTYTGKPSTVKPRQKRKYRDGLERRELWKELLAKMREGQSVTEAIRESYVSRPWVDKYLRECGEEERTAYRHAREATCDVREQMASDVFSEAQNGKPVGKIAEDRKVSESTVRRWIDEGWIAKFKELSGFDLDWDPARVAKESGASERTTKRLMREMRLKKLAKSPERVAELAGGSSDLPGNIGPEEIQPLHDRLQIAKQRDTVEAERRKQEEQKIASLYMKRVARNDIIAQIDLPRHTVVVDYNCLVRNDVLPFHERGASCSEAAERTNLPLDTVWKEYARLTSDVRRLHRHGSSMEEIMEYTGLRKEKVQAICGRLGKAESTTG
jgi:hypothetical protein